jgi:hypothetical protein
MKLDEMMNLTMREINKMTRRELAQVVSAMRSVARKRMERIEKQEVYSPAYSYLQRSGGIPSVKGLDLTALKNEYKRYKHFLSLKTSTVKGSKKYMKETEQAFEDATGQKWSYSELIPFYEMLDELRDEGLVNAENYLEVLDYMMTYSAEHPDATKEEILKNARGFINENYEQTARGFYSSDRF